MAGHAGRRQARCEPSGASPAWCSIKRRAGSDPAPAGGGLRHAGSGRCKTSKATSRATARMNRAAPAQRLRMLLVGDWRVSSNATGEARPRRLARRRARSSGIAGWVTLRGRGGNWMARSWSEARGVSLRGILDGRHTTPITLPPRQREGLYTREGGRPAGFCRAKLRRVGELSDVRVESCRLVELSDGTQATAGSESFGRLA